MDGKLTGKSKDALSAAIRDALSRGDPEVEPVHLLRALLKQADGTAQPLLEAVGADIGPVLAVATLAPSKPPRGRDSSVRAPETSRRLLRVINTAADLARRMNDEYISTEHLLVGLATGTGPLATTLQRVGATPDALLGAFSEVRGPARVATEELESLAPVLGEYGVDLTRNAGQGKLDPVIGRDADIRRLIQVLSRLSKNNPVLIGEPGMGATSVVEGLVQRIAAGEVPEPLLGKYVIMLDVGAMAAAATSRGEFESHLKEVLNGIRSSGDQVITFIDQFHVLFGHGAEGAVNAGGILKPMLAAGGLRMIGATTREEFDGRIGRDSALERHLQPVPVSEVSVEDTIAILRGLKGRYEAHHRVLIADAALVAAAGLSVRHITGRFLPDKAIDLVDEAASRLRLEIDSGPAVIDELRRTVDRMEREEHALRGEPDPASKERLQALRADLIGRRVELSDLQEQWAWEKSLRRKIRALRSKLDDLQAKAEQAQRDGDLDTASRLIYAEITPCDSELHRATVAESGGWTRERSYRRNVGDLQSRLAALKAHAERAQLDGDLETAARLIYGEIPSLDAELHEAAAAFRSGDGAASAGPVAAPLMVKEEVGPDDVAAVVSAWTGVPADRLRAGGAASHHRQTAPRTVPPPRRPWSPVTFSCPTAGRTRPTPTGYRKFLSQPGYTSGATPPTCGRAKTGALKSATR